MLKSFFTTDTFPKELQSDLSYPWNILSKLPLYLSTFSYTSFDPKKYPKVTFENPLQIQIGSNVIIEPNVYIKGPCIIEDHVVIRHGAYLRGNVLLQKEALVGHGTEVKHAIFQYKASAAHFNYVGNSILGSSCNLGAGVICANFRLDQKEIWITDLKGSKHPTHLTKMGAIIGDGSKVGCNSVLSPGTLVEKNTNILPLSHVKGWVGSSLVKERL